MAGDNYELPRVKKYIAAICRPFFKAFEASFQSKIDELKDRVQQLEQEVQTLKNQ